MGAPCFLAASLRHPCLWVWARNERDAAPTNLQKRSPAKLRRWRLAPRSDCLSWQAASEPEEMVLSKAIQASIALHTPVNVAPVSYVRRRFSEYFLILSGGLWAGRSGPSLSNPSCCRTSHSGERLLRSVTYNATPTKTPHRPRCLRYERSQAVK